MPEAGAAGTAERPERSVRRDDWRRRVTSGVLEGMSGERRRLLLGVSAAIVAIILLVDTVNVFSVLHDVAKMGRTLPAWEPITWEYSSGIAELPACLIPFIAAQLIPLCRRRWFVALPLHLGASLVFSVLHVGGMMLLRSAIYLAVGMRYGGLFAEFPYEYRKDLLAYIVIAAGFTSVRYLLPSPGPATPSDPSPARPRVFDIVDGASVLRTPVDEIVAMRAAGNYVEFLLQSGRTALMRTSLQEVQAALAPAGFLRTHRSWIVNEARVRRIASAGSGDFQITLDTGGEVPLSRRFPEALARLRNGR